MNDEDYMREAILEAEKSIKSGDFPIGCVIVLNGNIIARGRNKYFSSKSRLAHAEMLAINSCRETIYNSPGEVKLYTTYEPCPMCLGGILLNRIGYVVSGIDVDRSGAMSLIKNLPPLFQQNRYHIEHKAGILEKECLEVFMKGKPTKTLIKEGLVNMVEVERIRGS